MRRLRRHGFTMVEMLVSFALMALLSVLMWQTYASGRRQGQQVEEHADLIIASLLLREHLYADLLSSIRLDALPEADVSLGQAGAKLVLPKYVDYKAARENALGYKPVTYQWDAGRSRMLRDGKPIMAGVTLESVQFTWTDESPVVLESAEPSERSPIFLEVLLKGKEVLNRPTPELKLRLPAPKGTERFKAWVLAPHNRAVKLVN